MARERATHPAAAGAGAKGGAEVQPENGADDPRDQQINTLLSDVQRMTETQTKLTQQNEALSGELEQARAMADAQHKELRGQLADSESSRAAMQADLTRAKDKYNKLRAMAAKPMRFAVELLGQFTPGALTPDGQKQYADMANALDELEREKK